MDRMTGGSPRVEVYRGPVRLLHWLTVLRVAVQIPVGLHMAYRAGTLDVLDATTETLYSSHKLGGVVILLVAALDHDVVRKDNVLGRLIPSLLRR